MKTVIQSRMDEIVRLCVKRRVRSLILFGSAASDDFAPESDIDLIVDFLPMPPAQHADNYFGLMEDLKKLLGSEIDLLEAGPIRNPYYKQAIEQTKTVLYEAAA